MIVATINTCDTVTRFAPSPTGDLHLGGALVAMASFMRGEMRLRVEDLDPPRVVAGSAERIMEDLEWLGVAWRGEVVWQSRRTAAYERAIAELDRRGLVYPCDCSRAEIARVASAPHEGEEIVYPGACRDKAPQREMKREPALRVRAEGRVGFDDLVTGRFEHDLARDVGDFVLRRGDGVFAYQLAVAVDDAEMGITEVIRGRDLLASTPRQLYLIHQLMPQLMPPTADINNRWGAVGTPQLAYAKCPVYAHVPLVVGPDGARLSKRTPGSRVRELREGGISRERVRGWLLDALGGDGRAWPVADIAIPERW